jgi:hypothetical protein
MLALLLLPAVALLSDDGGGSAGSCTAAMAQSACGGRPPAKCDVCAGQHQHLLRSAGCSAAEVAAWCGGLPVDATELFVVEGRLQPGGQYVGTLTSQVQALIDGSFAPRSSSDWRDHSIINSTILRTLHLEGAYEADVSLSIPSVRNVVCEPLYCICWRQKRNICQDRLGTNIGKTQCKRRVFLQMFVLKLHGASIRPAANLSLTNTSRYQALVMMADTHYSAVIGGTIDASSLPAMPSTYNPVPPPPPPPPPPLCNQSNRATILRTNFRCVPCGRRVFRNR